MRSGRKTILLYVLIGRNQTKLVMSDLEIPTVVRASFVP